MLNKIEKKSNLRETHVNFIALYLQFDLVHVMRLNTKVNKDVRSRATQSSKFSRTQNFGKL